MNFMATYKLSIFPYVSRAQDFDNKRFKIYDAAPVTAIEIVVKIGKEGCGDSRFRTRSAGSHYALPETSKMTRSDGQPGL